MLNDISVLIHLLKEAGYKVFQTESSKNTKYPYFVYDYVDATHAYAGNQLLSEQSRYQLSYLTEGTKKELIPIVTLLKEHKILYTPFSGGPYDENDKKVTQFVTYVRTFNEI